MTAVGDQKGQRRCEYGSGSVQANVSVGYLQLTLEGSSPAWSGTPNASATKYPKWAHHVCMLKWLHLHGYLQALVSCSSGPAKLLVSCPNVAEKHLQKVEKVARRSQEGQIHAPERTLHWHRQSLGVGSVLFPYGNSLASKHAEKQPPSHYRSYHREGLNLRGKLGELLQSSLCLQSPAVK